ncbi:unnamed protein product [Protopolystoma xenopodis]|uniref:Uncharacterized protein n=1 Tax=Protopolystoma xenopodis TaxID=117903 RepID=A0A448WCA4_9PLAT|nr:unnamed protein product [Protopolystoma xenopodis]
MPCYLLIFSSKYFSCLRLGLESVLLPFDDNLSTNQFAQRHLPTASQLLRLLFEYPPQLIILHQLISQLSRPSESKMKLANFSAPSKIDGIFSSCFASQAIDQLIGQLARPQYILSPGQLALLIPHLLCCLARDQPPLGLLRSLVFGDLLSLLAQSGGRCRISDSNS